MVLELDTGRCASEDTGSPRRVDCEIPHQLGGVRTLPYKGVETSL